MVIEGLNVGLKFALFHVYISFILARQLQALYVGSHARAFRTTELSLRSQHNNNIGIKEKLLRYNPSSDTDTRGKGQWTHHSYPWNNNIHRANVDASDNRELLLRRKRSKRREGELNLALRQASIGSKFLLVVKLGISVAQLNQSLQSDLKTAFSTSLQIPKDNAFINKVQFQENTVEMYFVKSGRSTSQYAEDDLIPAADITSSLGVRTLNMAQPNLNFRSIDPQDDVIIKRQSGAIWMHPYFPVIAAAIGVLVLLCIVLLIVCCCAWRRRAQHKEANLLLQHQRVCLYPPAKPLVHSPTMIQPVIHPHYATPGFPGSPGSPALTALKSQPLKIKRQGLLERRGSNASLTIDLTPTSQRKKYPAGTPPKESSNEEFLMSAGNRLSRRELRNCLKNVKALYEEFWEIPMNHPDKVEVAGSGMKNRYRTIIPNPHTRVLLPGHEDDPLVGYINANYIRGYEAEGKSYIATQGPMPHTVEDFWKMLWFEKIHIVVMITKLREKNRVKCENYLPDLNVTLQFGEIEVKCLSTVERHGYTIRQLTAKYLNEEKRIRHYWYTAWPDHKTPETAKQLLELVKEVETHRCILEHRRPVVVHCSAGIGRTGCFIGTSIGMRQLQEERAVDVHGIVCQMRLDRGGMVQTNEQYEFLHQALCMYEKELSEKVPSGE